MIQLQKAQQMGCALLGVLGALCGYWQLWNRAEIVVFEGSIWVESISACVCCCATLKSKSSEAAASV